MTDRIMFEMSRWLSRIQYQEMHYDANILYENSNNNENWHSRVLRILFEYRDGNEYPVFNSFIGLMKRKADYPSLDLHRIQTLKCSNEKYRIDLLVEIGHESTIIIENKINWALDQNCQIERYVEQVRDNPLLKDKSNIYVVYLTADGTKGVEDYSLTEKAKKWLKGTLDNESIHFLSLSYAYDILPWLETEILPNIKVKSNIFLSSVTLYTDLLKSLFQRDEADEIITKKLINKMEQENIKMGSIEDAFLIQEQAAKFAERITLAKEQKMKEVAERFITTPLRNYLNEMGTQLNLQTAEFFIGYFNIIITHPTWNKCRIHLGIWQYKIYGGLQYIDPQSNSLQPDMLIALCKKFSGWKGDNNEPVWRYFDTGHRNYYALETWQAIENGEFVKYIESFVKEIYDIVQGMDI